MDHYSDNFITLLEEVERQGGELLSDECLPGEYTITVNKARGMGVKKVTLQTQGCEKAMQLQLVYDPSATVTIPGVAKADDPEPDDITMLGDHGEGNLIVCAECDGVQFWPRFQVSA